LDEVSGQIKPVAFYGDGSEYLEDIVSLWMPVFLRGAGQRV
jgi:hypothetical protein